MALPTSGPLSINDIRSELGVPDNSLRTLSQIAGFFSQPYRISNFYGYSAAVDVAYEFEVATNNGAYLNTVYASGAVNQFHELEIIANIRFRSPINPFLFPDRVEQRVLTFSSSTLSYSPTPIPPPPVAGFYYSLATEEILGWNFIQNPQNINILNIAILN